MNMLSLNVPTQEFPVGLFLARSVKRRSEVYRLRHTAFVNSGWIEPRASAELTDPFDDLETTVIIQAIADERTVGTARLTVSPSSAIALSMPCQLAFPSELANVKSRYRGPLVEFGRIAVDPASWSRSFRTTLYGSLVRTALLLAEAAGTEYTLAAVHSRLSMFYRGMFGFIRLADTRSYGDINEPTVLLGQRCQALLDRSAARSKFFHVSRDDINQAREVLLRSHPLLLT